MKAEVRRRARERLDAGLAALRPLDRFAVPPKGWIRAIRDAIGMSGPQLADRLGMTAQGLVSVECSEAQGRIQLNTLRRAAEFVFELHRRMLGEVWAWAGSTRWAGKKGSVDPDKIRVRLGDCGAMPVIGPGRARFLRTRSRCGCTTAWPRSIRFPAAMAVTRG